MSENKVLAASKAEKLDPKRWLNLVCIALMHAALMGSLMMPGAYSQIFIGEWGVDTGLFVQLTMIGFLTGAIFSIPMGILSDKYGVTKVLGIGMLISLAASIARVFCADFWSMYIACFCMGIGLAALNSNSVKFLLPWFKTKQMTTAMTLYVSGAGIGVTLAMMIGGMIPDMYPAYIGSAVVFALVSAFWFAFARMPKDAILIKDDYSFAAVKSVASNKVLILVSLAMLLSMCSSASYAGNVPVGMIQKGLDPATAAVWASFINLAGMPSNWIMGPICDAIKRIKPVMAVAAFLGSALLLVAWLAPVGPYTLPLFIAGAFVAWGNIALIKGSVGMIPTIRPEYMGTAGGLQTFFQNLAAFIIPSFIFTPLAGGNMILFFVFCAVAVILAGVVMMITPELGLKGKIHQEALENKG